MLDRRVDGADAVTEDLYGYWCDNSGCSCKSGALGALCQDVWISHANFIAPLTQAGTPVTTAPDVPAAPKS